MAAGLAVSTALVIGLATYLEYAQFEQTIEEQLLEAGRMTARAVSDDLELREPSWIPNELARRLHEFIDSTSDVHSISVIMGTAGAAAIFATTAELPPDDTLEVGRRAIGSRDMAWGTRHGLLRSLAVPLMRGNQQYGTVVVSVSFATLDRLRDTGRSLAIRTTVFSWLALFVLVELLIRSYLLRPIGLIRTTMAAAGEGQMSIRAPVLRRDELGAIAEGLNQMLLQIETFQDSLKQRVTEATDALVVRNRELSATYQKMFQLRDQLERVRQLAAVGETAAVVAHQVGTPLNLVSGHIQVLVEQCGPDSPMAQRLHTADTQVRRVIAALKGLLARARPSSVREPVDVVALLRQLCSLVEPALETGRVVLDVDWQDVPAVDVNALQLELALLNLISNALDAMPSGGRLTVSVRASASHVMIEIGDTGQGMAPDRLDTIFDPWVTTKSEDAGNGIGLSITRDVVTDHGGSVRVRSAPGVGSVFTVELPFGTRASRS
ncbi:MAG: ATP-binding protein [Acidobacteriota bacterium]